MLPQTNIAEAWRRAADASSFAEAKSFLALASQSRAGSQASSMKKNPLALYLVFQRGWMGSPDCE
jgi:hypothetical protein